MFLADKSQMIFGAVCCFPHPRVFLRDDHTHLARAVRFTTLPVAESYFLSIEPSPPATAESNPVRTLCQLADSDTRVDVHERGKVAAFLQASVPCVVPRQKLVAVEHETRAAFFEVV